MGEGLYKAADEPEPVGDLVELDVLVQRQDEHRREVESLTC